MSEEMDGRVIHREFAVDLEASGDGRTIDVRVVPYNVAQRVVDPVHLGGTGEPYDEVWLPGVFEKQQGAAHRVLVNIEHEQGIGGVVARGTELRDTGEALEGTFRMLSGPDSDKALELVNEGVLGGVSLEAKPLKSIREGDVVKRVKAHLHNIALCRYPAFADAQVLAVREQFEVEKLGEGTFPEPYQRNTEVDDILARVGYVPLVSRSVSTAPWNGAEDRFEDDQWERSCLIDAGGEAPVKVRCRLPVLEPDGAINVDALHRVTRDVAGGRISLERQAKGEAARRLIRYYRVAKLEAPQNLRDIATTL